ncbi:MAG TPA: DUF72 domain-containing protein [Roseateles sp.]|nr:DUF72 domain-containing protein [Roseateles sp.]
MQDALFPDAAPIQLKPPIPKVRPLPVDESQQALAAALPVQAHLGTSSWTYPGWSGLVWDKAYSDSLLSKYGLAAYSRQPLLRAVSIDRGFYRPLTASQYERYAGQVPPAFRFTVKAPSLVADAQVRAEGSGRGQQPNPAFLNPELALQEFIRPALDGLGARIGALVFQLSPLGPTMLARMPEQLERLRALLRALPAPSELRERAPDGVIAVEVRDPEWLTPDFVAVLREAGATYCLGLHPKLPPIQAQLPLLRALWPGPLVCRWNLNRLHGPFGYEEAAKRYGDFDRMLDPDPETRAVLARVIRGTTAAGHKAYVTISNKAEGCAPLSVRALAEAVLAPDPGLQG